MTFVVYCVLRTEHPCPQPSDVHGLVRFENLTEHPCPQPNDVRGLLRLDNRASMSGT